MKRLKKLFIFVLSPLALVSCGNGASNSGYTLHFSSTPSSEPSEVSSSLDGSKEKTGEMKIHMLEMNDCYGDSFIISIGNFDILVDGGTETDATYVRKGIRTYVTDKVIDLLVISHPHNDHTGGLADKNTYREVNGISNIVDYGYKYSTSWNTNYQTNRDKFIEAGNNYYPIYDLFHGEAHSPRFDISEDAYVEFLDTGYYLPTTEVKDSSYNHNDTSIAMAVCYKNTKFLMTGDLEAKGERSLISKYPDYFKNSYNIFKAGHHGSLTSNTTEILNYVKPEYIFISAAVTSGNMGTGGVQYEQHPYIDTLKNFAKVTDKVYWNGTSGTVNVECDGQSVVSVKGVGATRHYYSGGVQVDSNAEKDLPFPMTAWYKDYVK